MWEWRTALVFLCLLLAWSSTGIIQAEVPAEVIIGVDAFRTEESFLEAPTLAHRIIREAVTAPLISRKPGTNLFSMNFADSFQVDAEGVVWSYRVRSGMAFSNGEAVSGADICFSLIRCKSPGIATTNIESCSVRLEGVEDPVREWVEVRFSGLPGKHERQAAMVQVISSCPVIEQDSSQVFGSDLGKGTNLLASGDYQIAGFLADKSVQLHRFQRDTTGRMISNQMVEIKSYSQSKDALTALRVGTLSMFFNPDQEVERLANEDETLRVSDCGPDRLVYRRGFQFSCQDVINLASIVWDLSRQP